MKCRKCRKRNSYKADYCSKCGNKFMEAQRNIALNTGFVGFLKNVRKKYDTLTLSHITGTWQFRMLSILFVLGIGLKGIIQNGIHLSIKKSDAYTYQYNDIDHEYYLYTKEDETKLNLYALGAESGVFVRYFDQEDMLLKEDYFDKFSDVVITSSFLDNYYVIDYKKDSLKLYAYKVDEE